jgi:hypothetical protein
MTNNKQQVVYEVDFGEETYGEIKDWKINVKAKHCFWPG